MAYEGTRGGAGLSGDRVFDPTLVVLFGISLFGAVVSLISAIVFRGDLMVAIAAGFLVVLGATILRAEQILEQRNTN